MNTNNNINYYLLTNLKFKFKFEFKLKHNYQLFSFLCYLDQNFKFMHFGYRKYIF